jgi:integration host factor subunit beta
MNKSELIELMSRQHSTSTKDIKLAVNLILEMITNALANENRIEVRDFGVFTIRHRKSRITRNPKTGESVSTPSKRATHFRPGKELRDNVNV